MNRCISIIILSFLSVICAWSQGTTRPKLVVGIVVDQMREEYLFRFADKFGEGGFKRLMNDGFMLQNAHYNYVPTVTGPGHASIFTGSTPAIHGIIGNDFFDKQTRKTVNCVEDSRYKPLGSETGSGDVSPSRMLSSTITDELKLFTQMESRVVGISLKDRGAVLPAGHRPDGAYWFDGATGKFISSTYYRETLPAWVVNFNSKNFPELYLAQEWRPLLPIDQYTASGADDNGYENKFNGKDKPAFPYNLKELRKTNENFELITRTPFGNDLLTEMAKATMTGEVMGKDDVTDFLTISYSSTDIIGHAMGPNSIEIEDTYLRLDRNIKDLLDDLDKRVGQGNYILFLTADHAVADVPQYLKDNNMPADILNMSKIEAGLSDFLSPYFHGKKIIDKISNDQVFFNQEVFSADPKTGGIDLLIASELVTKYLMSLPGIAQVYSASVIRQADYGEQGLKGMIARGFNHKRSGDIAFITEPGWMSTGSRGTTHGSPWSYDTNVPVVFFGAGIKKGFSVRYHAITDIAPTLSMLLRIKFPSGCTGQPIMELFEKY